MIIPQALTAFRVTLLGYGALLSESSSRLTFPDLTNFRHVRVKKLRRVFAHPHIFLIKEGLLDPTTSLNIATLSAETLHDGDGDSSFVVAAFDVILNDEQRLDFIHREPEYDIVSTPFYELDSSDDNSSQLEPLGQGVICIGSKDFHLRGDIPHLQKMSHKLKKQGGIWHWPRDSGLLPAHIYLRHCLLAVEKSSEEAYQSFLKETYLADRQTTLGEYLETHKDSVMASRPPSYLAKRFGG